ncbi:hypothetical protein [Microbacterium candidum]|uniref:Uncharacterized protein n=1 Tax=Microbacterium candidum TaxID=3041922 RepID=A0ABT7N027_9MICO|nr:hypothetical protein [Microbacterium sp. ASV49]MDL9980064.1 hypothetical protein [Microbacterium sp. ASV49]
MAEFLSAWEQGDLDGLVALLHRRSSLTIDSDSAMSATTPTDGAPAVAVALIELRDAYPGSKLALAEINTTPGVVIRIERRVVGVVVVMARGRKVRQMWAIVNPEKLAHWNRA